MNHSLIRWMQSKQLKTRWFKWQFQLRGLVNGQVGAKLFIKDSSTHIWIQTHRWTQHSIHSSIHPLLLQKKTALVKTTAAPSILCPAVSYSESLCNPIDCVVWTWQLIIPACCCCCCCLRMPEQQAYMLCSRLMARLDQHLWPKWHIIPSLCGSKCPGFPQQHDCVTTLKTRTGRGGIITWTWHTEACYALAINMVYRLMNGPCLRWHAVQWNFTPR